MPSKRGRPTRRAGSTGESFQRPLCHAKLLLPSGSHTLATSIDSGADVKLFDENLAHQLGIKRIPLSKALSASALDGNLLGTITHLIEPMHWLLSGNHHKTIQFHILHYPHLPLSWVNSGCEDTICRLTGSQERSWGRSLLAIRFVCAMLRFPDHLSTPGSLGT